MFAGMHRLSAAIALFLVLSSAAAAAGAGPRTALTVAYREDGREPETQIVWTLRCDPVGGTHPTRTAACRELARLGWPVFRPVPPDTACTAIYGGPQTAVVSGVVAGRRVWTRLRRDNGCEIARWERLAPFLVPGRGVPRVAAR